MKILLAEDEKDLAGQIATFLRGIGHTVRQAVDGKTALRWLKKVAYEVAIIDLALPELDGVQLVREIHDEKCEGRPAVIIITAHPGMLPVPDPQHYGAVCEMLRKPSEVTMPRLKTAVAYCGELLAERKDRERGSALCDSLMAEKNLSPQEGKIAVVNLEEKSIEIFDNQKEAIKYAGKHGGKRPYLRYFDTKFHNMLRRVRG